MQKLIRLVRRISAWLSIRATERRLYDLVRQYRHNSCPVAALANDIECERLSAVLAAKRAAYVAAYRAPGQRMTWEMA